MKQKFLLTIVTDGKTRLATEDPNALAFALEQAIESTVLLIANGPDVTVTLDPIPAEEKGPS